MPPTKESTNIDNYAVLISPSLSIGFFAFPFNELKIDQAIHYIHFGEFQIST